MPVATPTLDLERRLLDDHRVVIAVDEVGRGALAGPVSIGAVALDATTGEAPDGVRDSKALSAARRRVLAPAVITWARASTVVDVSSTRIDEVGIVRALGEGARAAATTVLEATPIEEAIVLLDGHHDFLSPLDRSWRVRTVVKGDATCTSIAAASIIAKVHRDQVMAELHHVFPHYGWDRNVGYGTKEHRRALHDVGICVHHRRSWRLIVEPTLDL